MIAAVDYKLQSRISYREGETGYAAERCWLDYYYPVNRKKFATVIWLHGGGLTSGEPVVPDALKNQGFAVASVGYRLHPAVKAPVYLEDAAAATAWVLRCAEQFGAAPDQVVLAGASAGAYLALMVGLDPSWLAVHGVHPNRLAGIGSLTGQAVTHFTVRAEQGLPGHQATIDALAPLYHVRADAPPVLLVTGDRRLELFGRYEENAYLARMFTLAGHRHHPLHELTGRDHAAVEQAAHPLLIDFVHSVCCTSVPPSTRLRK
jgi:acetyl esterase/lipase